MKPQLRAHPGLLMFFLPDQKSPRASVVITDLAGPVFRRAA
ncbi:hypothetical protein [Mesorhizobium sp.]|nr:hypothetical protein [Mesorhizobium sp.]